MVQALITISDNSNRVINIIKAKHALRDKSETIEFIIRRYIEYENEPDLKPEFIAKMKKIKQQESIQVDNFAERYGLDV